LAGSRVTECGACDELQRLAELLGAPVYAECNTSHGRLPIPAAGPLYAGPLPLWSPKVRQLLDPHDVIFLVGMNLRRVYIWSEPEQPISPQSRIIHADVNVTEIGKNYPSLGVPGDLKETLAELNSVLGRVPRSAKAGGAARHDERRRSEQAA